MARNLYFVGTAGSGKSTMVHAFQEWMNSQGLDCVTANLDPGAGTLQYSPDLDVRDYVRLEEIMQERDLGPNGAQVAAADMIAMNAQELAEVLETFATSYILIDTPGQIELFTFRASGGVLIDAFGREESALVYLNDPALVKSASGFVSSVLLSATVQFRHSLPFINVLSKADLLSEQDLERVVKWSLDPFALYEALFS
ncbi:MAG: ATP/GTP-binding protein, partial [Thermoplasmata archaeon]